METITSSHNEWVAEARKLKQKKHREARGLFLAEGIRLSEEAAKASAVEEVFYHEALADTDRGEALLNALSAKARRFFRVSAKVMDSLAETETPQGIVCVCRRRQTSLQDFRPPKGLVLAMDGIQDPGNLGTILRTLWAAGGQGLICLRGTTDPYGGKCVRASMGGVFHLPVFTDADWTAVGRWAMAQGYAVVAADAGAGRESDTGQGGGAGWEDGAGQGGGAGQEAGTRQGAGTSREGVDFRVMAWPEKTLLCIGSEAFGLVSVPAADVAARTYIPLAENAESLNAAVAAGILIFAMK